MSVLASSEQHTCTASPYLLSGGATPSFMPWGYKYPPCHLVVVSCPFCLVKETLWREIKGSLSLVRCLRFYNHKIKDLVNA
jgi:hypothetical protein